MAASSTTTTTATTSTFPAIIAYPPDIHPDGPIQPKWRFHPTLRLSRGPAPKELQIRMLAAGVCHTDALISSTPASYRGYPFIPGHEGAGYVEAVGEGVTVAQVGDPVLLSYDACDACECCVKGGTGAWCERFGELNSAGVEGEFLLEGGNGGGGGGEARVEDGGGVLGKFFGQSSFAGRSLVKERCVVNVKGLVSGDEELKLLAPLGCGLMTGAGNVVNIFDVGSEDIVLVTGLGGVGLGAVMAAKAREAKAIVVVDRVKSRLALARELGATHVVDTTGMDLDQLAEEIKKAVGDLRIGYGLETTGVVKIVEQGIRAVGHRGHFVSVGVPPMDKTVTVGVADMMLGGKTYSYNYFGDSEPRVMAPQMMTWWREGKFPLEKLVKFFPAKDVDEALNGMHDGTVIKPVLLW
ncbi:uncharacterized protein HMPREF1541_09074 [Cyphellophora europaea CBS 101466]|uniref:Enoyl reductase (ER) domain-containing protein n=1 Tax=Cyphellophora europaea (strain CBS 101466) TaxID=1220924 RepID=W2RJZ7_CYPE1|nr:uncharacterized protein HMPREF1541_09074 [Cyphellophora europaea CBS 101466]ETN36796.1 hypothetical protein HMPREF1541_09074 [Cyphellophora europaea CBS 101466]